MLRGACCTIRWPCPAAGNIANIALGKISVSCSGHSDVFPLFRNAKQAIDDQGTVVNDPVLGEDIINAPGNFETNVEMCADIKFKIAQGCVVIVK
jgi:hypothetical protein